MARLKAAPPISLRRAHDAVIGEGVRAAGIRPLVAASWKRSLDLHLDPDRVNPGFEFDDDDLREYRDGHPMSLVLPTIHSLLIRHSFDAGLIVAIGDEAGRLLWIDGDRTLRRKAEGMLFVEGADWSEAVVGTSAPGTALALDHGIQIQGAEHFNRIVHPWSCTAVPVHDPSSGAVLGVIDITGGADAAAPATLPLVEAAVAAAESELRIRRLDDSRSRQRMPRRRAAPVAAPLLSVLGTDVGRITSGSGAAELSARHAEILTLLAWHSEGLSVDRLAAMLYDHEVSVVTLRAEMVRLRKVLERVDPSLVPLSRPYRLSRRLELDAHRVLAFLDRGAHRVALGAYTGGVLPTSNAPGIIELRDEVSSRLRDALLTDASVDTLLAYARTDEAAYDAEVWRQCLRLLPPKSPKRASVVARLERIEADLG
ncbi:transcriptional regulator [Lacisediminihabitans changchengi]|uniref:transcriptional regulator n=1 Tax=Lacisediminihabitans changchengi TaxID=2787634 RepID=UPI0027DE8315|nr:transcriptional regulator [Lacisediminihabitans changchengi]